MSGKSDIAEPEAAVCLNTSDIRQTEVVTFDDVLKKVGEFGKFQIILYTMFSLPYLETSMQLMGKY